VLAFIFSSFSCFAFILENLVKTKIKNLFRSTVLKKGNIIMLKEQLKISHKRSAKQENLYCIIPKSKTGNTYMIFTLIYVFLKEIDVNEAGLYAMQYLNEYFRKLKKGISPEEMKDEWFLQIHKNFVILEQITVTD
jgi:hypothetical protein